MSKQWESMTREERLEALVRDAYRYVYQHTDIGENAGKRWLSLAHQTVPDIEPKPLADRMDDFRKRYSDANGGLVPDV